MTAISRPIFVLQTWNDVRIDNLDVNWLLFVRNHSITDLAKALINSINS